MYLLDTNVVSELRRARPHGAVLAWIANVDDARLHLSAVTIGEIQAGIELPRLQDRAKAEQLSAWLDQLAATYTVLHDLGDWMQRRFSNKRATGHAAASH